MSERETLEKPPGRSKCSGWFVRWLFSEGTRLCSSNTPTRTGWTCSLHHFCYFTQKSKSSGLSAKVETGLDSLGSCKWKVGTEIDLVQAWKTVKRHCYPCPRSCSHSRQLKEASDPQEQRAALQSRTSSLQEEGWRFHCQTYYVTLPHLHLSKPSTGLSTEAGRNRHQSHFQARGSCRTL